MKDNLLGHAYYAPRYQYDWIEGIIPRMTERDSEAAFYSARHGKRKYLIQNVESPYAQYIASVKARQTEYGSTFRDISHS